MKFRFLLCLVFCAQFAARAQFVNIPDPEFRKYLSSQFPSAMNGNLMDTTHFSITNCSSLFCDSIKIANISGLQFFDNLQYLHCAGNTIYSFPSFPQTLKKIWCSYNQLSSLPPLPPGLQYIDCQSNNLLNLPVLPPTLTELTCNNNKLSSLPAIPNGMLYLNCGFNQLSTLPVLPLTLKNLSFDHNQFSVFPALPNTLNHLDCSYNPLFSIPSWPPALMSLTCDEDSLSSIPALPLALNNISCRNNQLSTLPALPLTMKSIYCSGNKITSLPALNDSLLSLVCSDNLLTTIPSLPLGLSTLYLAGNSVPFLPPLPPSLFRLDYSDNPITILPLLPPNLYYLFWNDNSTNILPALPASLKGLSCTGNALDSLPVLPNGLQQLICEKDSLTFLPVLPDSLLYLDCSGNLLHQLPHLPAKLKYLDFGSNLVSQVTFFPASLRTIYCSYNPLLSCLPKLPMVLDAVRFTNTSITCLPNRITVLDTIFSWPKTDEMDLCTPVSGCECAWNIAGNLHHDTTINCLQDSLSPGKPLRNLKVRLSKNNIIESEMSITSKGEYSFDTDLNLFKVEALCAGLPFNVVCPAATYHNVSVTPNDSMHSEISFGIQCNGIDAGVRSIAGRYRPTLVTKTSIIAGDVARFFNVECSGVKPGTVTTVITGPVSYVEPAPNALTPDFVNGNTLTYNIPDLSVVDVNTAFSVMVLTHLDAVIGNLVWVETDVTNVNNDMQALNNHKSICFPIVNSLDPNAKVVSPEFNSKPGDMLDYTVFFQNTGNDTAYKIMIRDTLSENLDLSTFEFLASSHPAGYEIKNRVLTFYFLKINLVDDKHNEPESHGWLQYKIALRKDLPMGTKTKNTAHIFFDYNPAIITNTAINTMGPDTRFEPGHEPLLLPDAITANHDGHNDALHILNPAYLLEKHVEILDVKIFNRWGQQIVQTKGNDFHWYADEISSSDAFSYSIIYRTISGNTRQQNGSVTVIK